MITRRQFMKGAAATLAGASLGRQAYAQDELRILVGFSAGGAVDVVARATGDAMRKALGKTVIIENKTGAAGAIAVQALANADGEGRTLLLCPSSILTLRPSIDDVLGAGAERQIAPISPVCEYSFALTVGPGVPAKTLKEFVAWCKSNPKQASFGTPGHGTAPHVIGAMFAQDAHIPLLHVPYRGGAQAIGDLLGGQLPAMVTTLPIAIPLHKSGKLRILASTAARRLPLLTDVPTFAEEGYAGMQFQEWFGMFVPAKTPAATIESLNAVVRAAVGHETTRKVLEQWEYSPRSASVAEFTAMMKSDTERWQAIVKRLDIKKLA